MSRKPSHKQTLSSILSSERRLIGDYNHHQQMTKQQILRKEHSDHHFVQTFSWKYEGHLLKYQ